MSILSLLTSVTLVGLVYGLSFLPSASLERTDDEVGLGLIERVVSNHEAAGEEKTDA
ncbi:hypothetical protein [Methyloceanibacter methanicus]|uniref:hypothetical protein n=1 Tax=Methyloceanibacter methanicus TaxID=1774968 RepID=UPI00130186DD|nr:hypothetical protein [Methyloceanibacter methanicus]